MRTQKKTTNFHLFHVAAKSFVLFMFNRNRVKNILIRVGVFECVCASIFVANKMRDKSHCRRQDYPPNKCVTTEQLGFYPNISKSGLYSIHNCTIPYLSIGQISK